MRAASTVGLHSVLCLLKGRLLLGNILAVIPVQSGLAKCGGVGGGLGGGGHQFLDTPKKVLKGRFGAQLR